MNKGGAAEERAATYGGEADGEPDRAESLAAVERKLADGGKADGRMMEEREEQQEKARSPMEVRPSGKVTLASEEQLTKAP